MAAWAFPTVSGWEKGQVENQVGVLRERFFTPRLRVASYEELNAWLLDRCVAYAKAHKHPELPDRTIWQAFEAERPQLVQITGPFDGFHATQASVSKTCLVRFDNNKYSVASGAVGRPVEIQAYADRVVIRQDGTIVGEHRRRFGRGATIYDPFCNRNAAVKPPHFVGSVSCLNIGFRPFSDIGAIAEVSCNVRTRFGINRSRPIAQDRSLLW